MTKRPYDPALKAEVNAALAAAEKYQADQNRKAAAREKARRDIFTLQETGKSPVPDDGIK